MKYYILIKYYYHIGTYGAKKDGPMGHPMWGDRYEFDSIQQAKDDLREEGITWQVTPRTFQYEGNYTLFHGEYSRPSYHIRKIRKKAI